MNWRGLFGIVAALLAAYFITHGSDEKPAPAASSVHGGTTIIASQPLQESPALIAARKEQLAREEAIHAATVKTMTWSADYGVMVAGFTFSNPSDFEVKDLRVRCTLSAASGTVVDTVDKTIFEIVPPRGQKTVSRINMGFVNSQAKKAGCRVERAVPTAYRPPPASDRLKAAAAK